MIYREKLVLFTKLKKKHIQKFDIIYTDHKDYENIRTWERYNCKMIYDTLVKNIDFGADKLTDETCVWCIYNYYSQNFGHCNKCYYGKKYGECLKIDSLYKKYITDKIKNSFTNKVYKNIINEINSY